MTPDKAYEWARLKILHRYNDLWTKDRMNQLIEAAVKKVLGFRFQVSGFLARMYIIIK